MTSPEDTAPERLELVATFAASGEVVLLYRSPGQDWRQCPAPEDVAEALLRFRAKISSDYDDLALDPPPIGLQDALYHLRDLMAVPLPGVLRPDPDPSADALPTGEGDAARPPIGGVDRREKLALLHDHGHFGGNDGEVGQTQPTEAGGDGENDHEVDGSIEHPSADPLHFLTLA